MSKDFATHLRSSVSELQDYSSHNTNILILGLSPKLVQSYTRKTVRYLALYSGTLIFTAFLHYSQYFWELSLYTLLHPILNYLSVGLRELTFVAHKINN